MAKGTTDQKAQEQNLELRKALSDAYAFVDGQRFAQSFAALTFEDLVDRQIDQIEGKGTSLRPNALDRITAIEGNVRRAVESVKQLPASAFARPDPKNDVNTEPQDTDE